MDLCAFSRSHQNQIIALVSVCLLFFGRFILFILILSTLEIWSNGNIFWCLFFFLVFCWFGFGITHTLILIVNFATSWIQCIVCICISFFLLRIIVTVLYYISVVYIFFCRNTFLICVRKLPWIVRFAGTLWKLSLNKKIYVFLYNNNETHWLTQKIPRRK